MPSKNLVLRTMYIDPEVDDELRTEAFDSRTSKNDLLRQYLKLGMEVAKSRLQASGKVQSTANANLVTSVSQKAAKPKTGSVATEVKSTMSVAKPGARKPRRGTPVSGKLATTSGAARKRASSPTAGNTATTPTPRKKSVPNSSTVSR